MAGPGKLSGRAQPGIPHAVTRLDRGSVRSRLPRRSHPCGVACDGPLLGEVSRCRSVNEAMAPVSVDATRCPPSRRIRAPRSAGGAAAPRSRTGACARGFGSGAGRAMSRSARECADRVGCVTDRAKHMIPPCRSPIELDVAQLCCFADYLITDLPDCFARWGRGFPAVFCDRRKRGRLAGCRTAVGAVQAASRLRRCAAALRVTRRRPPDAVLPWPQAQLPAMGRSLHVLSFPQPDRRFRGAVPVSGSLEPLQMSGTGNREPRAIRTAAAVGSVKRCGLFGLACGEAVAPFGVVADVGH